MQTVNIPGMKAMIEHVVLRLGDPMMFWGGFGIGKTQAADQAATAAGAVLCDIRVAQYEAVDFRGVPDVQDKRTVWNLPATMPFVGNDAFPDDRLILLSFDEINAAQDDGVLAVCYQIMNEGRCGEHLLKPNVRIIAMGNRETDRGVTRRMPLPLCNRMTHAEVVVDPDALVFHLQQKGVPRLCLAFLLFRKTLINTFDPALPQKVVATPRTWEKAFRYWVDPLMPESVRAAAITGAVGDGPAGEFLAFTQLAGRIIPIKRITDNPRTAPLPDDDGMCWATVMNISGDMTRSNVGPLAVYLDRIAAERRFGPEYKVAAWKTAVKRDETLDRTQEYVDFSQMQQQMYSSR